MLTPYKNTKMSGDVVVYRNMNSSERSKVINRTKDDWMSDHNKESFKLFHFIPNILKTDFDVISTSVKYHGLALSMTSKELMGNFEIVTAAVKQNGWSLKVASRELRGNKDIVMAAVKNQGFALQFSSDELKGDFDIAMAAVEQCGYVLQFTSRALTDDS